MTRVPTQRNHDPATRNAQDVGELQNTTRQTRWSRPPEPRTERHDVDRGITRCIGKGAQHTPTFSRISMLPKHNYPPAARAGRQQSRHQQQERRAGR